MRLAVYTEGTTFGGADISLSILLQSLDPKIDITVVGVDEEISRRVASTRPNTDVLLVPAVRGKWDLGAMLAIARALRKLRPDVLHANLNTPVAARYVLLAAILTPRIRVVAVEQLATVTTFTVPQRILKRVTARRLAAHVAVGDRAARQIERQLGLTPKSIRVIYNAVPDRTLRPGKRLANGPIVGSVARLDRQKGLDVLVRALPLLPGVSVVLVGGGPERMTLEQMAKETGVDDRLIITGWREDARDHLTGLDLFVLPSRFEGFPLAILEAMLACLPVVATDVGSVAEAVIDGETGLLVPPEDPEALAASISELLADPERRRRMGAAGRRRVLEHFSPANAARSFEAIYNEEQP
jgi:glycosyltransferase involved in cell wall biosynthesis